MDGNVDNNAATYQEHNIIIGEPHFVSGKHQVPRLKIDVAACPGTNAECRESNFEHVSDHCGSSLTGYYTQPRVMI